MARTDTSRLIRISLLVLLLFFAAALATIIVANSRDGQKRNPVAFDEDFTLLQPLMLPEEPSLPDDYYLVRPRGYEWTWDDVERWFAAPDGTLLDELHAANGALINDILEAAP